MLVARIDLADGNAARRLNSGGATHGGRYCVNTLQELLDDFKVCRAVCFKCRDLKFMFLSREQDSRMLPAEGFYPYEGAGLCLESQ